MSIFVQSKFGTVKTVTTSQTLTVTLNSTATPGNTLLVAFAEASASGTPTFTSLQDNHANNFTLLQSPPKTSGFTGPCGMAVLANVAAATTSVTLVYANSISDNVSLDLQVYEVAGNLVVDVNTFNTVGSGATTQSFPYTTTATGEFTWIAAFTNASSAVITPTNGFTIDQQPTVGNTGTFFGHLDGDVLGSTTFSSTSNLSIAEQWNIGSVRSPGAPLPFTPFTKTIFFVTDTVVQM